MPTTKNKRTTSKAVEAIPVSLSVSALSLSVSAHSHRVNDQHDHATDVVVKNNTSWHTRDITQSAVNFV
jgi:hypothetical protein